MYRYIPFQEIIKEKWNGTVHYSPNGNTFGYYWYLKAVYKEWDAVIEDDYQSVMPIIPRSNIDVYKLTPQLGPYSVQPITASRTKSMMDIYLSHADNAYYPLRENADVRPYQTKNDIDIPYQNIKLIASYDELSENYSAKGKSTLKSIDTSNLTFTSSIKPEVLIEHSQRSHKEKNTLLRIMYNAMHRGLGWSTGILHKETNKYVAMSFFVSSHEVVHEVYYMNHGDPKYRILLTDMFLKTAAGKPSTLVTYQNDNELKQLAFEASNHRLINIKPSALNTIKRLWGSPI